jgi:hypothetical protein
MVFRATRTPRVADLAVIDIMPSAFPCNPQKIKTTPSWIQDLEDTTVAGYESADAFLANCAGWLSKREDLNHGLLSLADALRSNKHIHRPPFAYCHVASKAEMVGCAIFAEPDGLVLSETNLDTSAAFFRYLYDRVGVPSRIFGPVAPALRVAELFAAASNRTYEIHSKWRVHRLDQSQDQDIRVRGQLTLGTVEDQQLVSRWGEEYDAEKPANVNVQQFLLRKLEDGLLYFWKDEGPKALATISGTSCTGPRISAVFTPRLLRGNGYAFAMVYQLGNNYFESGSSYITLNTELGDPVERMYGKIGYRIIGEKASVVFK